MPELCEWNPRRDCAALVGDGCQNEATLSVGRGKDNWHLCESCANLPRFARKKHRVPLRREEATDATR